MDGGDAGDIETVPSLMTEDAVFLVAGQTVVQSEVPEIRVAGE